MPNGFDNTRGVVRESSVLLVFIFHYLVGFSYISYMFLFCFQLKSVRKLTTNKRASLGEFGRYPLSKGNGRTWSPLTLSTRFVVVLSQRL